MALRLALSPAVHMIVSLVPQPGGIEKKMHFGFWVHSCGCNIIYINNQQYSLENREAQTLAERLGWVGGGGVDSYVSGILSVACREGGDGAVVPGIYQRWRSNQSKTLELEDNYQGVGTG